MNNRKSFIVGIKSTKLSTKEKIFLKRYKPWGVILFTRNIKDIKQTFNLTSSIRKIFNDKRYPILIDQEGGRVNRLKNIISYHRYVDDIFCIVKKGQKIDIMNEMNEFDPSLKFTVENMENNKLNFLDTTIFLEGEKLILKQ